MLFNPLDMAAQHGGIVDFEQTAFDFTLAHFGDIAFDVSGPLSPALVTDDSPGGWCGACQSPVSPV